MQTIKEKNNQKLSRTYEDSLLSLIGKVQQALALGQINQNEAAFILGLAIRRNFDQLIREEILEGFSNLHTNRPGLSVDYFRKMLLHVSSEL